MIAAFLHDEKVAPEFAAHCNGPFDPKTADATDGSPSPEAGKMVFKNNLRFRAEPGKGSEFHFPGRLFRRAGLLQWRKRRSGFNRLPVFADVGHAEKHTDDKGREQGRHHHTHPGSFLPPFTLTFEHPRGAKRPVSPCANSSIQRSIPWNDRPRPSLQKNLPFAGDDFSLRPFLIAMSTSLQIAVLPGDGIGPEVMEVALEVLRTALAAEQIQLDTEEALVGGAAIDATGEALPASTLAACENASAILFGSVGGPKWESLPPEKQPERAALLPLRRHFRLFANLRPGLLYPELVPASPLRPDLIPDGIDLVCVRELTGGIYFGEPKARRSLPDGDEEALDTMVYKRSEIERIADVAAKAALERDGRVCSVDKANVLTTSVLWRETVSAYFSRHYPQIELSHLYVDNAAMQMARQPNQFDVLLTENMFGDILSDEMGIVCGSLGMLCSASLGLGRNAAGHRFGLYEPAGGSAPDIAGQGIANPCAQILSAAMLLRFSFGLGAVADRMEAAVREAVREGYRTGDIAFGIEPVSTAGMGKAILDRLARS